MENGVKNKNKQHKIPFNMKMAFYVSINEDRTFHSFVRRQCRFEEKSNYYFRRIAIKISFQLHQ